ncbi:MAG: hypothetical protein J7K40_00220 [candidate division Zixibacteria bacterium]|nr:hypothetical protein [candidate division Zixibacteria bacterium]
MPFCPNCRYEYREGITVCPDCKEKLVESLSDEITVNNSDDEAIYKDWVQIARLTSPQYAELVLEGLRVKDIPAVILSGAGHFGQTGQFGISSFRSVGGAYSILVPKAFIVDADKEAELILGDEWKKARLEDNL